MNDISRRSVMAAAWSAPVLVAVAAAPSAAASGQQTSSLTWNSLNGDFQAPNSLILTIPAGSAAVGSTGAIELYTVGMPFSPSFQTLPAGWSYGAVPPSGILSSSQALAAGSYVFTTNPWIDWTSGYDVIAEWSNNGETSSTQINVGPAGRPTLAWDAAVGYFGGTNTLTVTAAPGSYAVGELAAISGFDSVPTAVAAPTNGWIDFRNGGQRTFRNFQLPPGASSIAFTWPEGQGTTFVTASFSSSVNAFTVSASIQLLAGP
ncbi:hypothetical protein [Herbiconiux sp. A18JL235]|uniref:Uncharacterized protein n=1 Tax=Herbiconiux sp. A18JL235 TaxID=3152363 RepID=A0AB39BGS6_9MICO